MVQSQFFILCSDDSHKAAHKLATTAEAPVEPLGLFSYWFIVAPIDKRMPHDKIHCIIIYYYLRIYCFLLFCGYKVPQMYQLPVPIAFILILL